MRIEYPQSPEENLALGRWVEQRIPDVSFSNYVCLAFFEPGEGIRGVVLYHNYRTTDIEIVFAGDGNWARRDLIMEALAYPYSVGCQRITALARQDNTKVRKLLKQLGFKEEGKLRKCNPDGTDLFIYGLLQDELRLRYPRTAKQEAA